MATIAGNSNYAIAIASATTGAAGSETPSGDIVYLFAESVKGSVKNNDKRKIVAAEKIIKIVTGKTNLQVKLTKCTISKEVTATATAEINAITDQFRDWGFKGQSAKCYIFVKNTADSTYVKISWSRPAGVHQQFMAGYIEGYDWSMMKGKIFVIDTLTFSQVN